MTMPSLLSYSRHGRLRRWVDPGSGDACVERRRHAECEASVRAATRRSNLSEPNFAGSPPSCGLSSLAPLSFRRRTASDHFPKTP